MFGKSVNVEILVLRDGEIKHDELTPYHTIHRTVYVYIHNVLYIQIYDGINVTCSYQQKSSRK